MGRDKLITHLILLLFWFIFLQWPMNPGYGQEIPSREKILSTFSGKVPQEWGEGVSGVRTRLNTDQRVVALTFDACGGSKRSGFDTELIRVLEFEKIPSTVFVSGRWIDSNPEMFQLLAKSPLFEIENHGLNHKPCSAVGRAAYGIEGTKNAGEIYDEIEGNALKIQALTGRKPGYFRSATAFCDDICVGIATLLGYEVVGFSVLGDGGATYKRDQVKKTLLMAPPAAIVLLHLNHPRGETAKGVIEAIPELKKRGFRFVKLSEYTLR